MLFWFLALSCHMKSYNNAKYRSAVGWNIRWSVVVVNSRRVRKYRSFLKETSIHKPEIQCLWALCTTANYHSLSNNMSLIRVRFATWATISLWNLFSFLAPWTLPFKNIYMELLTTMTITLDWQRYLAFSVSSWGSVSGGFHTIGYRESPPFFIARLSYHMWTHISSRKFRGLWKQADAFILTYELHVADPMSSHAVDSVSSFAKHEFFVALTVIWKLKFEFSYNVYFQTNLF